jgi:thiol-disulfide isomerase/thioredoxin
MLWLAVTAGADVIHLNAGGLYKGEVTGFSGSEFRVTTTGGASTNLAADAVRGVDFEHGYVSATLETKPIGSLTGKLWLFDKQRFNIEVANGETRRIALADVARAAFTYTPSPERPRPVPARHEIPPAERVSVKTPTDRPDIEIITHGERVEVSQHLVNGKVTVVDFFAKWCGPCRNLAPVLEEIARQDSDVAIRKVDIVRWGTPVAEQYLITAIPRVQIYNRDGQLVRTLAGFNEVELRDAIDKAK